MWDLDPKVYFIILHDYNLIILAGFSQDQQLSIHIGLPGIIRNYTLDWSEDEERHNGGQYASIYMKM